MGIDAQNLIVPDWPAPANVRAVMTTRQNGVSKPPYDSFNLATHVGDQTEDVIKNRQQLRTQLQLKHEPCWLEQVHSNHVMKACEIESPVQADASFTRQSQQACVVMTADCLPVLFCDRQGSVVAAAHAGWRGLADGILEATINSMQVQSDDLLVWLGPAIGAQTYEIDSAVRNSFVQKSFDAESAFVATRKGHWLMDMYQLARQRLQTTGVNHIYGGDFCTYTDRERFYSFRRDDITGRMASLIWLQG